jgi:hypothetical protein
MALLFAKSLKELKAVAFCQLHQAVPDTVLLPCGQTGFVECTPAEAVSSNANAQAGGYAKTAC